MNQKKYDSMLKKIDKISILGSEIRALVNEDPHIMTTAKRDVNEVLDRINASCLTLNTRL